MSIVEFDYVDEDRLNTYVAQIRSPVHIEKIPVWTTEIGITGVRAKKSHQVHSRELMLHEKIDTLVSYLSEHSLLSRSRIRFRHLRTHGSNLSFVFERCLLRRVQIRDQTNRKLPFGEVRLWVGCDEQGPSSDLPVSVLVEDYRSADEPPRDQTPFSGYSVLKASLAAIEDQERERNREIIPRLQEIGGSALQETFEDDPVACLTKLGCFVSDAREFSVLYRVREFGLCSIFGYPIFVCT